MGCSAATPPRFFFILSITLSLNFDNLLLFSGIMLVY